MKVCIVSMQKVPNFGSVLQAYALQHILMSLGHEVEFIDIKKNEADNNLLNNSKSSLNVEKTDAVKINNRYLWNRIMHKLSYKQQSKIFTSFMHDELKLDEHRNKNFDICVIGSDEVFNCLNKSTSYGFTSQLFGNVSCASKVITYAASCGSTTFPELPFLVRNRIQSAMKNISAFSVRDENTDNFVKELSNTETEINLDPVLIYDFSSENRKQSKHIKMPSNACVVYAYGNRISDPEEINHILAFCSKYDLQPVAVGSPQFWIKKYLPVHPFDIGNVFSKAKFVITDTFHGTIFSYKYSSKFAVLIRESNKNKLRDLVNRLNISNHILCDNDTLEDIYQLEKDWAEVECFLSNERNKSLEYLRKNTL